MNLNVYFNFNGNCQEALDFYSRALHGKISEVHLYSENHEMCSQLPADWQKKIMHATFTAGSIFFMASDVLPNTDSCCGATLSPEASPITLSLNFESEDRQTEVFDNLAADGKVSMALNDTFWGARFGMLTDKFGIKWMFNCEKPKKS